MNISELQDLKLTEAEWHTLFHGGETCPDPLEVDMLVLAGLAEWDIGDRAREHGEWLLTEAGHAACNAIDLILDWDDFAFVEPTEALESLSAGSEEVQSV
jgi:hypothetical protein